MRGFARLMVCVILAGGLSGCREQTLYSGLSQREANEMMVLLDTSGFAAGLTGDGRANTYAVTVPASQTSGAARVLARAGLPREKIAGLTEILPRDSYLTSASEDRARLAYGTSLELTNTLMQVAGVAHARVHVALAEKNVLGQVTSQPTASVLIRFNPDTLGPNIQETVRSLVAHSIPGLAHDRVAVTMLPDVVTAALSATARSQPAGTARDGAPRGESAAVLSGSVLNSLFGNIWLSAATMLGLVLGGAMMFLGKRLTK